MIDELKLLKYSILIFKPDPCKKCIVKACCTQPCKEKQDLVSFVDYDTIAFKRFITIILWVSVLSLFLSMLLIWI